MNPAPRFCTLWRRARHAPAIAAARLRGRVNRLRVARLFPSRSMEPIIRANRNVLCRVERWIDDETYSGSVYRYGIPAELRHRIDLPLPAAVTYSDAIAYLSLLLTGKIRYCELGVSAGKNLFQLVNWFRDSEVTGFDIEEINSVLEGFLTFVRREEWQTAAGSLKTGPSSLTEYEYSAARNRVRYLSGDIFDEGNWTRLRGSRFNLVFSDAFHSPEAILFEHEMIEKYGLLDDEEFVLVWDDLGGGMGRAFEEIWRRLRRRYELAARSRIRVVLNGWLGDATHQVGIILNTPGKLSPIPAAVCAAIAESRREVSAA